MQLSLFNILPNLWMKYLTALDLSCLDRNIHTFVVQLVPQSYEDIICNNSSLVVCFVSTFSLGEAGRGKVTDNGFQIANCNSVLAAYYLAISCVDSELVPVSGALSWLLDLLCLMLDRWDQ